MKVVVIGCTHAGTAAVKNIVAVDPKAEITVYEKNDNISFLSCGIALYVGGVAKDPTKMFYSSPEELSDLGVKVKLKHEILSINLKDKQIMARNLNTNETFTDTFDKLIMTTGSWPIIPNIDGIDLENILLCKNYQQANTIIEKAKDAQNITIIGAGYIGVEMVEAFEKDGKNVTLIDSETRILNKYLDNEFTNLIEEEFKQRNVTLALEQTVTQFEGSSGKVEKVITTNGEYLTDMVILCVGFRPNTNLLKGQIEMMPNGAIIVNEYMQTSNMDVYAAGDSCAIHYNPTGKPAYIPLATNAVRMGTIAGRNINKPTVKYVGTQGTSGLHIYDYSLASTGITETSASFFDMNVKSITITDNNRPEFMPSYEPVTLKVVYENETNRILGAQILSKIDVTQTINTLSICIQNKMTIDELAFIDFFFQPHFNKPMNILNQVGLQTIQ